MKESLDYFKVGRWKGFPLELHLKVEKKNFVRICLRKSKPFV